MIVAVSFAIIVARRLSIGEYGLWGVILSSSIMLATPVTLWSFWASRFTARGDVNAGVTGLFLTVLYWVPGAAVYLAVSLVEELIVGWGFNYMLIGLPLLFLQCLDSYFSGLAGVVKPELKGYRGFVYETLRLIAVYLSVIVFDMGLKGVILSVEVSLLASTVYIWITLAYMNALKGRFSRNLAFSWLKAWFLPSLNLVYGFLKSGVRAVVSWVTGSEEPVAYLNVGFSAEAPLLQASWAGTAALYARTLRSGGGRDLEETIKLSLLFTGYMLPVFIVLSKTITSIYNPAYINGWPILVLVSIYAVLNGLSSLYATALLGIEKVDLHGIPDRKKLISSYLFKVPLSQILGLVGAYLLFLAVLAVAEMDSIQSAEVVVSSLLLCTFPAFAYLAVKTRESIVYRFPFKELVAVTFASLASALYYVSVKAYDIVVLHFWSQIPVVILHLIVGLAVYLAVLFITSSWMRKLARDTLIYVKRNFI